MTKELRAVLDTNIFISCLIGKGKTLSQIYKAFLENQFTALLTPEMIAELLSVIDRPELRRYFGTREIKRFKTVLEADSIIVPVIEDVNICRDAKDDMLLECGVSALPPADCIVTGDTDLLTLKTFRNISIITPKEFLALLKK